jgi:ribosomal protein S18 acetylase RimI-like enzyme
MQQTTMFLIRPMTIDDYELVIDLMKQTPGVTFRDADSRENTARYLDRNPNLSFVAYIERRIVGCIMSGHDGRRGYLQHLVVDPDHRRKGIAGALVEHCLSSLEKIGIHKCHIDVLKSNEAGSSYWERRGWTLRTDINRYSFVRSGGENV